MRSSEPNWLNRGVVARTRLSERVGQDRPHCSAVYNLGRRNGHEWRAGATSIVVYAGTVGAAANFMPLCPREDKLR